MKIEQVSIDRITVGERFRRDMGDLDSLGESIAEVGLLQPIGVDETYRLVYGHRRLIACTNLGWTDIPCIVVNIRSILAGEYAENAFRKEFTESERVAIGLAVEAELGNRQSQGRPKVSEHLETYPKGNTVDIAADRAGFGCAETYKKAKAVVEQGTPELIDEMDSGDVTITSAALIASQPREDQNRILAKTKAERRAELRVLKQIAAAKKMIADAAGVRLQRFSTFRKLAESVRFIAEFALDAEKTWEGIWESGEGDGFMNSVERAQVCLARIGQGRPNAKRPGPVVEFRKGEASS